MSRIIFQFFTTLYKGTQGFARVYKSRPRYTWGIQGFTGVFKGIQGYTGLQGFTKVDQGIHGVYRGLQRYTGARVYKGIQGYTRVVFMRSALLWDIWITQNGWETIWWPIMKKLKA